MANLSSLSSSVFPAQEHCFPFGQGFLKWTSSLLSSRTSWLINLALYAGLPLYTIHALYAIILLCELVGAMLSRWNSDSGAL